MKVVLDTNIILASISPFSKFRSVLDRFEQGDYILCLTCAIAANADYLVTNDRDFRVLKDVEFPKIKLLKMDEFMEVLEGLP